jgi:menaquinone-dependent protoporphyrinogen IX oxidase
MLYYVMIEVSLNNILSRLFVMKGIVVYKTIYGSTKKYAEWIAGELCFDICDASKISSDDLMKYDVIIFGGGLYAGGILGINLIIKAYELLKNKKLIVFTVGLADPKNIAQFKPLIDKTFTKEMQETIEFHHFRGAIDYKRLGLMHKTMMSLKKGQASLTKNKDNETQMLLDTYGQVVDFTDKSYIRPLVERCKCI